VRAEAPKQRGGVSRKNNRSKRRREVVKRGGKERRCSLWDQRSARYKRTKKKGGKRRGKRPPGGSWVSSKVREAAVAREGRQEEVRVGSCEAAGGLLLRRGGERARVWLGSKQRGKKRRKGVFERQEEGTHERRLVPVRGWAGATTERRERTEQRG
jgi:hypothetical protein